MHASNLDLPPPIRHPHTIWARLDAARAAPRGRAPRAAAHQLRLGSIRGDPQAAAAPPLAVRPADQVTLNLSTGSKRCNRTFMALLKKKIWPYQIIFRDRGGIDLVLLVLEYNNNNLHYGI